MASEYKPGARLLSAVCTTEMVAVRVPAGEIDITIGGAAPAGGPEDRNPAAGAAAGHDGGVLMGKRYVDTDGTIELLCTKPGPGVPALGGVVLQVKEAKALPSSD